MRSRWGSGFWQFAPYAAIVLACGTILPLGWKAQLVAWPVALVAVLTVLFCGRSIAAEMAPPVADVSDLAVGEASAPERTGERAGTKAVRAAGTITVTDARRNCVRARGWHPVGDSDADRAALLAGQAFRVTAMLKARALGLRSPRDRRSALALTWQRSLLPLARRPRYGRVEKVALTPPASITVTRPVSFEHDQFPVNDLTFTVVTIQGPESRTVVALPSVDVPLVDLALELAAREHPA